MIDLYDKSTDKFLYNGNLDVKWDKSVSTFMGPMDWIINAFLMLAHDDMTLIVGKCSPFTVPELKFLTHFWPIFHFYTP